MRDLAGLRQYVYDYLDLRTEDIRESLLNAWADEGFRRIIQVIRRWPFYESTGTILTETGIRDYPLPEQVNDVESVEAPWGVLSYIDVSSGTDKFHLFGGHMTSQGRARAYSIRQGRLHVWPLPEAPELLNLVGWRPPNDWVAQGDGGTPDFPPEFEDALLLWLVYRGQLQQCDEQAAAVTKLDFAERLDELVSHTVQNPSTFPMVLGGGGVKRRPTLPLRLAYPWE